MNIGYCCIAVGINEGLKKKDFISVNRKMTQKTFNEKGLTYVSELAILNLKDCLRVLKYNLRNNILVYRMSSDMFPWFTHYNFTDLPNWDKMVIIMREIGDFVLENNIRVGFHPGPYCVIASEKEHVAANSIDELNKHAEMLDYMGLPINHFYSINIHLNTTQPTLEESAERFCNRFQLLSDSAKSRLTVENDDKLAQFTVQDLYRMVHSVIGIPIIADSLHHFCHSGGYTWEETFKLALTTWGDIKPLCHHSSSRKLHEEKDNSKVTIQTHSDFLYEPFINFDIDVDVELECKMKDIALLKYRKQW
jgi:UV DNA damage endonuclease